MALFTDWRAFEDPQRLAGGIPDYTPTTIAKRLEGLGALQARLAGIDRSGWSVPQQVDYHLVRAEMNGMAFHLRVLQPFARDPAYYASLITAQSDTPSKEGHVIHGAIKLYEYPIWPRTGLDRATPLTPVQAADLAPRLQTIPPLMQAARASLAGANARDLWVGGVRAFPPGSGRSAEPGLGTSLPMHDIDSQIDWRTSVGNSREVSHKRAPGVPSARL